MWKWARHVIYLLDQTLSLSLPPSLGQNAGKKTSWALQLWDKCMVPPSASVCICPGLNYTVWIFPLPSGNLQSQASPYEWRWVLVDFSSDSPTITGLLSLLTQLHMRAGTLISSSENPLPIKLFLRQLCASSFPEPTSWFNCFISSSASMKLSMTSF